ncbi:hypothetical protein FA95DRAFT_1683291 [Auriscalpium vulgare]|uniref:Uncharacterized protein n=1 Tax=Auriscalpium vulgare TaxID=40419 RepID=A0ACB8RCL8_9AGAM|nr:hypothetical protein FA95DRAFT_1683291 [Auriscalpium vulgare]
MFPLIPTLALAFVSFLCSCFVILRILIPVLPPHPLSKRVRPSEFGLPNFRSLSAADKSHVWLAGCDILALAIFVWEAISEYKGSAEGFATASDAGSAARLWFALSLRQTCLLVVSAITLLHVRLGRAVTFGPRHWVIWAPLAVLIITSTALAGVLAGADFTGFFIGYMAYSATVVTLCTIAFGCLVGTLLAIKRNLAAINDVSDPWPPAQVVEEKPRPSFATEDIDGMREGSSWITSRASSRHDSISAFSFSTHHTHTNTAMASNPSLPAKSSFWFKPGTPAAAHPAHDSIPPVPQIPSPYRNHVLSNDPDPFRRSESPLEHEARSRMGSQSSWLTSTSGTRPTATAWSFPTTHRNGEHDMEPAVASTQDLNAELLRDRPVTPGMAGAQVLGGYGYSQAEMGLAALAAPSTDIDISVTRILGWMAGIWVPFALASPYFIMTTASHPATSNIISILLAVSITISSPILALNIIFRHPIPIPSGLFETPKQPPSAVSRAPSPASTLPAFSSEYKRSTSMTVVDGRRSTDVWVSKGDAVEGKNRVGRALGMLAPAPKLSVLPMEDQDNVEPLTPPLPIQDDEEPPQTPHSLDSAELGRTRTRVPRESKSSAYLSSADESLAFNTRIMVAQRHYSTMATTVVLPASPTSPERRFPGLSPADAEAALASGVSPAPTFQQMHLRTRSASSASARFPVSPPPASPLPPTPPSIRNGTARLLHRKSYSSGFDFGAVGGQDAGEIDALSAGLLPLLVPGLRVGADMRITEGTRIPSPAGSMGASSKRSRRSVLKSSFAPESEFGGFSFSAGSPEFHSTPHNSQRARKSSGHKRLHHFSLPSLSLGKDGLNAWKKDVNTDGKLTAVKAATLDSRRNTVWGGAESAPAQASSALQTVQETAEHLHAAAPFAPTHRPTSSELSDMPQNVGTARSSLAVLIAALERPLSVLPSAGSDITLFDLEEEGPLAESTPPDYRRHSAASSQRSKNTRRSSIMYIKSDDNTANANNNNNAGPSRITYANQNEDEGARAGASAKPDSPPTASRFAQWSTSTRALVPKPSKMLAKLSLASTPEAAPSSPGGGLRPLALLQERNAAEPPAGTRALSIGKKTKQKAPKASKRDQENADQENATPTRKRLRSLKLGRSDTTRERAVLRATEALPDVVVRPPSQSYHSGYAYTFR